MNELIYCCPHCHAIASSGVTMDEKSADLIRRTGIDVLCSECRIPSRVAFSDLMLTATFTDRGEFAQMICTEVG